MKKWCEKLKGNLFFVSQFALDDFKTKYAGSVLGFFWAFVQPVITVLIYWFIFQIGFKNGDVDGYPFILWLVSGLLPWFFVSDSITNATSSLVEYSYLVKKVLFNINILPVARVVSVFFVQLFLIGFTAILFIVYGQMPSVYWLQLVYYIVYMLLVCIGISYFTASSASSSNKAPKINTGTENPARRNCIASSIQDTASRSAPFSNSTFAHSRTPCP